LSYTRLFHYLGLTQLIWLRSKPLFKVTLPIELHPFVLKFCPFDPALIGFAQSPEPHPYTQPKRTAKVAEKAESKNVEYKISKVFGD